MPGLRIIDTHTMVFSSRERGIGWQRSLGDSNPAMAGTVEEVLDCMKKGGITHSVMISYTPTRFMYEARIKETHLPADPVEREKKQQETKDLMVQRMVQNNEWACQQIKKHPELIAFTGLDPVYMSEKALVAEIEDKVKKGAKGVTILPSTLEIYGNDKRLWPAYDKISKMGVPMSTGGSPKYFAEALSEFPNLKLIVAHLGGHGTEVPQLCKKYPNLYLDLSGQLTSLDKEGGWKTLELVDFIRKCGAEHITWGSSFPMNDPVEYSQLTERFPLNAGEKELIAHKNAQGILGIK